MFTHKVLPPASFMIYFTTYTPQVMIDEEEKHKQNSEASNSRLLCYPQANCYPIAKVGATKFKPPKNTFKDFRRFIQECYMVSQCSDVDECSIANGGCEHECINTEGSFYCDCRGGHELMSDNQTCEGNENH